MAQRDKKTEASASLTPMQRAEDLRRKMTIEEKAMQLFCLYPMSLLGYTGISGNIVIEPGPVEVSAGSSSTDIRSTAKFTITGKMCTISGEHRTFLSVTKIG